MSAHKSYCRICSGTCGIELEVENNKILNIRGDDDNPISRGYFCVKGTYSRELHNGEERLFSAKRRRADGSFEDVKTPQVLEEIATKLSQMIAKHGPRSVALYYGTGSSTNGLSFGMAQTWLAAIGSPELYSSFTVDQSAKWVGFGRMGMFATGKPVLEDLDVALIAGNNPVVSHLGYPLSAIPMSDANRWVREDKANGTKLIVVDPRRTETARNADLYLQIKPGTDATLFAAMIRLILQNGWEDKAFCKRFLTSVERLRSAVEDFTQEFASRRTDIPADQIVAAAKMFGTAVRRSASSGTGTNMARHSNLNEHLLECLNALCGGYRKAGDPIRVTGAIFDAIPTVETVVPPNRTWEAEPRMRGAAAGKLNGEFPSSRLPDEILRDEEDRIRALVVSGGNPAASIGGTERTSRALKSLELLIVLDPRMTETGRMAHYVIPATLPYEREDMTINQDLWFPRDFVQYMAAHVEKLPCALDDWEVFWELGKRMNAPMDLITGPFGMSIPKGRLDMTVRPTTTDMLKLACKDARTSVDEVKKYPSGMVLPTNRVVQAASSDDGSRLDVCPPDVYDEIIAVQDEVDEDTGFRYLLTSRRAVHVVNSSHQNAAKVVARHPVAPTFMNPADIAAEGLEAGALIKISSGSGQIVGQLTADAVMKPGVISMPHNWGSADPADGTTSLTAALVSLENDLEAINFMPRQSGIPVNIGPHIQ